MNVQFELTVKITGTSLDEIDKGLAQAAGERIIARLEKPLQMPNFKSSGVQVQQVEVSKQMENAVAVADKAAEVQNSIAQTTIKEKELDSDDKAAESKRGRTAKSSDKNGKGARNGEQKSEVEEKSDKKSVEEISDVNRELGITPSLSPKVSEVVEETATYADALIALKVVNKHQNMVVAREVLSRFGVSRVADLGDKTKPSKVFRDFINYCCNDILKKPVAEVLAEK